MMFSQDRDSMRAFYREAWRKQQAGEIMQPLEAMVAQVVAEHPEYHRQIEADDGTAEFTPEQGRSNPYLHMGMHLAIREQLATNRPPGIAAIHRQLADKFNCAHEAEHQMMESLGAVLWNAQRRGVLPDDEDYMQDLKQRFEVKK